MNTIKVAVPIVNGKLSLHFGHCDKFVLIDYNPETKDISKKEEVVAPAHEPGLLPRWLASQGVNTIIAGGMGQRAQTLFNEQNIEVLVGAPADAPEVLVKSYLDGTLSVGENVCDH